MAKVCNGPLQGGAWIRAFVVTNVAEAPSELERPQRETSELPADDITPAAATYDTPTEAFVLRRAPGPELRRGRHPALPRTPAASRGPRPSGMSLSAGARKGIELAQPAGTACELCRGRPRHWGCGGRWGRISCAKAEGRESGSRPRCPAAQGCATFLGRVSDQKQGIRDTALRPFRADARPGRSMNSISLPIDEQSD